MQNRTDIINTALQRCNSAGINLAFQDVQEAAIATAAYDRCRRLVLAQYPWSFAQKYETLAQNVSGQPFGYEYSFTLPGDCLQVIDIRPYAVDDDGNILPQHLFRHRTARWEIVGRDVVSNAPLLALRYVSSEDTSMPEYFAEPLAWRLAFEISPYIAQSTGQTSLFLQMYQQTLEEAKAENDRQTHAEETPDWAESEHIAHQFHTLIERW